jgi:hypothetical protein
MTPWIWRLSCIAFAAIENGPQFFSPTLGSGDPGPVDPGRIVPHVLTVPTVELRDPVTRLIQVISDDFPLHAAGAL